MGFDKRVQAQNIYTVEYTSYCDKELGTTAESRFKVVCRNGLPLPVMAFVLISMESGRQNRPYGPAYYLRMFAETMDHEYGITDFSKVTASTLERYGRYLRNVAKKSNHTIRSHAQAINALYSEYHKRGVSLDASLYLGTQKMAANQKRGAKGKASYTEVYRILMSTIPTKELQEMKAQQYKEPTYDKFLTASQIAAVTTEANLREKAVLNLLLDTGQRNSTARLLKVEGVDFHSATVFPDFAKNGVTVPAALSDRSFDFINKYMSAERARVLAGSDSPYLFVNAKGKHAGQALTYDAFYMALKRLEEKIKRDYPGMEDFKLHSHACRSTFAAAVVSMQQAELEQGHSAFSDSAICAVMGLRNTYCLTRNYDRHDRAMTLAEKMMPKLRELANERNKEVEQFERSKKAV